MIEARFDLEAPLQLLLGLLRFLAGVARLAVASPMVAIAFVAALALLVAALFWWSRRE